MPKFINKRNIINAIISVLVAVVVTYLTVLKPENKSRWIGRQVPDFTFHKLNLDKLELEKAEITSKSLLGKPYALDYTSPGCSACRYQHPLIVELSKQRKIDMYAIIWDDLELDTKRFLIKYDNPYKAIFVDQLNIFATDLGIKEVPHFLIIDKDGKVVFHQIGALHKETIANKVLPLLDSMAVEKIR